MDTFETLNSMLTFISRSYCDQLRPVRFRVSDMHRMLLLNLHIENGIFWQFFF